MTLKEAKAKTENLINRISVGNYTKADKTALIFHVWSELSDYGFVDKNDPQVYTGSWDSDADAMLKVLKEKFVREKVL